MQAPATEPPSSGFATDGAKREAQHGKYARSSAGSSGNAGVRNVDGWSRRTVAPCATVIVKA